MKPTYCKPGEGSPKKKGTLFSNASRNNFFVKVLLALFWGLVRLIQAVKGNPKIEITWEVDKEGNRSVSIKYEN